MKYPGGKNADGTYQFIINHIPPHETYIEGFLGSGAIIRYKKKSNENIGIEIDPETIRSFWNPSPPGIKVLQTDFLSFLKKYRAHSRNVLMYLDPPYPRASRRSSEKIYRYEMTDEQHEELLSEIRDKDSNFIVSTYPNKIYSHYLKGWNRIEYKVQTRVGSATELLYMNYDTPGILHDFNFLGKDFTDRQRIKRKINNRIRLLEALPELERNAIVTSIIEKYHLKHRH